MLKSCLPLGRLLLLSLFVGCGPQFKFAPVSGTVTLNGEPLTGAIVGFEPLPQGDSTEVGYGSYAETDDEGYYTMKSFKGDIGAIVGPHRVMITTVSADEGPNGETINMKPERVPAKYADYDNPLKFEVPPEGTDQANFQLDSKPGPLVQ